MEGIFSREYGEGSLSLVLVALLFSIRLPLSIVNYDHVSTQVRGLFISYRHA